MHLQFVKLLICYYGNYGNLAILYICKHVFEIFSKNLKNWNLQMSTCNL